MRKRRVYLRIEFWMILKEIEDVECVKDSRKKRMNCLGWE